MSVNPPNYCCHFWVFALTLFFLWSRSSSDQAQLFNQQSHPQEADNSTAAFAHLGFAASFPSVMSVSVLCSPVMSSWSPLCDTGLFNISSRQCPFLIVFLLLLGSVIFWSTQPSKKQLYQVVTVTYNCSASLMTLSLHSLLLFLLQF